MILLILLSFHFTQDIKKLKYCRGTTRIPTDNKYRRDAQVDIRSIICINLKRQRFTEGKVRLEENCQRLWWSPKSSSKIGGNLYALYLLSIVRLRQLAVSKAWTKPARRITQYRHHCELILIHHLLSTHCFHGDVFLFFRVLPVLPCTPINGGLQTSHSFSFALIW